MFITTTTTDSKKSLEPYNIDKAELFIKWHGHKAKLLVLQRGSKSNIGIGEKNTEYKGKNTNLIFIANLGNSKIYYKISDGEFWFMFGVSGSKQVYWQKLESHDLETLLAFSLLTQKHMDSSAFGIRFYLKNSLKRKMQIFNDRFHRKKTKNRR